MSNGFFSHVKCFNFFPKVNALSSQEDSLWVISCSTYWALSFQNFYFRLKTHFQDNFAHLKTYFRDAGYLLKINALNLRNPSLSPGRQGCPQKVQQHLMYVCVIHTYVCMYACMYACMYIRMYTSKFITYIRMYTRLPAEGAAAPNVRMHVRMYVYTCLCIHVFMYVYTYVYKYMHM